MMSVPPGPGVVQFELADQNIMAEHELEEGRVANYEALKAARLVQPGEYYLRDEHELRKDHMWDLLS